VSIITLVVLAERSTTEFVFETLTHSESGWNNPGVCFGLGLLTITYSVSGQSCHPLQITILLTKHRLGRGSPHE
jgi:hypothetical protein